MSPPAPTAKGTLAATPLVNLVVYALDHHLTGTLVLEEPSRQKHAVYFVEGAPAKVRVAQPVARLGDLLVELGHLNEEDRESTFERAVAESRLHGESLVAAGTIDERLLREALREQGIRKILFLAALSPETYFGYFDKLNYLQKWGGETVRGRPLALAWRLVQAHANPGHIAQVLAAVGDRSLRLHLEAPIRRFNFGHAEQSVLDVLRAKPQPYAELAARELVPRPQLDRLLYTLAITKQFDRDIPGAEPLGADEAPSSTRIQVAPSFTPSSGIPVTTGPADSMAPPLMGSSPSMTSMPPLRTSTPPPLEKPEVRALKAELRELAARVDENLYEVLGVARDASVPTIQSAYLTLAKKFHPDRLGSEYADVMELASRLFARISEAHQVLTDPIQRREYTLKLRKAGAEANEQEHVQRVLRAATAFQKAEVLLKRNNLAEAETYARQALTDDPDQAEYLALVAWIASQKPEPDLRALIRDLDRAISMQPNNIRAHWYRGSLYKRIGKDSRAIQDFRFIVERDPKHVDATRELRLYTIRARSNPGGSGLSSFPPGTPSTRPSPSPVPQAEKASKSESSGIISKLFKR